ncbi:MAG: gamma-glutamylcyclotransferase [Cytophagaceae bacterium]|nr:gamma-glutamylcyclotransferase [Cytophagaceae bacterium]
MEKEYLFVYGTLLNSFPKNPFKNSFHKNASYLGAGKISAKLYDLGKYPGIVKNIEGENFYVFGEIYEILNPKFLQVLDEYENYFPENLSKSEYTREKSKAFLISGQELMTWVYWYNNLPNDALFIESGDYIGYLVD